MADSPKTAGRRTVEKESGEGFEGIRKTYEVPVSDEIVGGDLRS